MTETETLEQPAGGALEEALKEALDILDSPAIEDEEQLAARLDAIQEVGGRARKGAVQAARVFAAN